MPGLGRLCQGDRGLHQVIGGLRQPLEAYAKLLKGYASLGGAFLQVSKFVIISFDIYSDILLQAPQACPRGLRQPLGELRQPVEGLRQTLEDYARSLEGYAKL